MQPLAIYQQKDLIQSFSENWISIEPKLLSNSLYNNIFKILSDKYIGLITKKNGFIFNIQDIIIIDNKIGEYGNVEYYIKTKISYILPKLGMLFVSRILTLLPEGCILDNPHFQNLIIDGKLEDEGYKIITCGCILKMNMITVAKIDAISFQRGKFTCICHHIC